MWQRLAPPAWRGLSTAAAAAAALPAQGLSIDRILKKTQQAYPNCLTLIQIGDFYEMLDEDARRGAEILGITLTKRDRGKPKEKDMAGIPCKSLKTYLQKFAKHGERVVILDQVGEKASYLGNMPREVVRVVTPGTLCEDELLNPNEDNFLCTCLFPANKTGGEETVSLAWTDVSTTNGILVQSIPLQSAEEALRRIGPREVLLKQEQRAHAAKFLPWLFEAEQRREHVISLVDGATATAPPREQTNLSALDLQSLAMLKTYVERTLMPENFDWNNVRAGGRFSADGMVMMMDSSTRSALEISKSNHVQSKTLFSRIDFTSTSGGTRLLRARLEAPSLSLEEMERRFDAVDFMLQDNLYGQVQQRMRQLRDPTRALQRLLVGRWSARDLQDIFQALNVGRALADELLVNTRAGGEMYECSQTLSGVVTQVRDLAPEGLEIAQRAWERGRSSKLQVFTAPLSHHHCLADLHQELLCAFGISSSDGLVNNNAAADETEDRPRLIARGYNAKYDELMDRVNSQSSLSALLTKYQQEHHAKIRIEYTEKQGHFIDVPKSVVPILARAPEVFRALRVGTTRFTTEALERFNHSHKESDEELKQVEDVLLNSLAGKVIALRQELALAFHSLCVVDVAASSARAARELKLTRPIMYDRAKFGELQLGNCRHAVVEQNNPNFVGNDVHLVSEGTPSIYLITGPNMGGKSTYLRSCALVPILAQSGIFVPCDDGAARISIVDKIFARIGAADDLVNNRSTFMVEMEETANFLQNATSRSLVIVDELGRGTSPREGFCLAQAVLEELANIGCRCLFATHFHALTEVKTGELAQRLERGEIQPYTTEVVIIPGGAAGREKHLVFTFKILPGVAKSSFGMNVARLAGIPASVLDRAKQLLKSLENNK